MPQHLLDAEGSHFVELVRTLLPITSGGDSVLGGGTEALHGKRRRRRRERGREWTAYGERKRIFAKTV